MMMTTAEIIKRVRRIEIKTRGLSNHIFSGEYQAAFKGRGMSFSEVREYTPGDEVKTIDWNVTARFSHPYVKIFEEERELTVMLLVDISPSSLFGTRQRTKRELITEIAAVLAFAATTNNDKVGVLFFSHQVEKFIPPKKGRTHVLRIIRELIALEPEQAGPTRIAPALEHLNRMIKKRTICFLLSDLISSPYERELKLATRKHDLVGIQVFDPADQDLPRSGLIQFSDAETGEQIWVDTRDRHARKHYAEAYEFFDQYAKQVFRKSGASRIRISTTEDYVKILQGFFKDR